MFWFNVSDDPNYHFAFIILSQYKVMLTNMKKRKWQKLIERTAIAAAIALLVAVLPLPMWTPEWFLYWQVPAVVFLFIVYIGKLLIDTILFPPSE
jgi:uncharacterized membrane protein